MTIDGNMVIVLSAAVAIVAAVVGSAWAVGRKIVRAEVALEQLSVKVATVDTNAARITALEQMVALMKQAIEAHDRRDTDAFERLEGEIKAMRKELTSLHEDVTEVLVAAKLKGRAGRGADES